MIFCVTRTFSINATSIFTKRRLRFTEPAKILTLLLLAAALKDHGKFKSIGGNEYLNKLINTVPTAAHIKSYAELIINKARRRGLIEAAANFNNLARDQKKDTNQIIEMAEIQLFNVSEQHVEQNIVHLRDILSESFERLQYLQANKSELRGIASGFRALDNFLAGFQKSDLFILAARPGMGKTGFALNLAYNIAYNHDPEKQKTALYFSLEMSQDQLVDRLLSMHTGINNWNLRTGHLNDSEFERIREAQKDLVSSQSLHRRYARLKYQ